MTLSPYTTPEARQDVDEIGYYLGERNFSAARRFARSVNATIQMLLRSPELGERWQFDPTGQMRYRTVIDFKNYLIFYRRVDDVLEIVRILHGARDYDKLFD